MPPLVPLPSNSIVNVQFFGTCCDQTIINLFQYKFDGATQPLTPYEAYMADLALAITQFGALEDRFLTAMPDNYVLDFIRCQPVYPARMRFVDTTIIAPGTVTSSASQANLAASIERFSSLGAKHGVGRVQLVLPDGVTTDGVLDEAGYEAALGFLADQIKADVLTVTPGSSGTWQPCLFATKLPNAVPRYITGTSVKKTVRTMRRRTVGLGI